MSNLERLEDNTPLASPEIYEIITHEGMEELKRPNSSLAWSALVAGICISFSIFAEGFIKVLTPDVPQSILLDNLGYTVGFIIVILGRFQLFTENTITVILPLLDKPSYRRFLRITKLWGIVLLFNMIGTFMTAALTVYFPFFSAEHYAAFIDISKHAVEYPAIDIFFKAIPAGFLIATLVWMMPSVDGGAKLLVIMLMTYLIAMGDFAHIVAGSTEVFLLLLDGSLPILDGLKYLFFACLGNIIGGTCLFTVMAYAQVRKEL